METTGRRLVTAKSGLVPLIVMAIGTGCEVVPFVARTVTAPVAENALVVVTVSVVVTAVPPLVVTEGAEQVIAVSGEDAVQVNVMVDPLVPSKLRVRVDVPLAGTVSVVLEGVTEKSAAPVNALTKALTSGVPRPVTRS